MPLHSRVRFIDKYVGQILRRPPRAAQLLYLAAQLVFDRLNIGSPVNPGGTFMPILVNLCHISICDADVVVSDSTQVLLNY